MTLAQLRTKLRSRIGNPSTADVSDAKLTELLNDALEELRDKYRFLRGRGRAKFTTTLGVDKYRISAITDTLLRVWDRTNKRRLNKIGPTQVATKDFASPVNGKPMEYARFEDYLQLFPPPDSAYVIELFYRAKGTTLVADGDIPDIPATWHKGITILGAFNYYDGEAKDLPKAVYENNALKNWVADKPSEADEEAATTDAGVELPTFGSVASQRLDFDRSP